MQQIQDVYNRIQEIKKEQKEIKNMYRDAIEGIAEYRQITEKLEEVKLRKKELEMQAWEEVGKQARLEEIKKGLKLDKEMMSDIALSALMSGETVKITDQDNNEYEPIFSVRFKKANVVSK